MLDGLSGNEIVGSVNGALKKRFHTPLYGTFILAWAAFHWDFLYTALFVNQDLIYKKTGLLKNEYLHHTFFNYGSLQFYLLWLLPFLVTWLIIWKLPRYLLIPAFKKDQQYRTEQRKITLSEERQIELEETKREETSVKRLDVTKDRVRKEKAIVDIDPTALWPDEYAQFKEANLHHRLIPIMEAVYEHAGATKVASEMYGVDPVFEVPMESLVTADTNDLIKFDRTKEKIELTEKGKYFIKRFSSDKG